MAKVTLQKASGSSYSVPPNVKGSGAGNNHGTVARGGSVASHKFSNVAVSRYNAGVFGSTVVDNATVDKAVSANVLAKNSRTPVAPRITRVMLGTAEVPSLIRTPLSRVAYRTVGTSAAFRNGQFNLYTGKYNPAPVVTLDSVATDNAAVLSRSVPGKLVFMVGNKPRSSVYKAKTN